MWLMLQYKTPDDYVIATREAHTIRDFLSCAFDLLGLDWKEYVEIDQQYFRPAEVNYLLGDFEKAHRILGWQPKISFEQLVEMMIKHDMEIAKKELLLR
jgi:GDPmannose 4,6-dehydratase